MGRCRSTGRSEKDAVTCPRMKTRIGILTSGGDCPGLNAVLRGAALAADKLGWEVLGFRDGFEGLLPPGDFTILDRKCTEPQRAPRCKLRRLEYYGACKFEPGAARLLCSVPPEWRRGSVGRIGDTDSLTDSSISIMGENCL